LFKSSAAKKWTNEPVKNPKLRTIAVKLKMSKVQKQIFHEYENTYRYVHNNALERIKKLGEDPNFQNLRNLLVTANTKMDTNTYKFHSSEINRMKSELNEVQNALKKCDDNDLKDYFINHKKELQEVIREDEKCMTESLKNIKPKVNPYIRSWELETPKDIRANAVKKVCDSYSTAISNLINGNIKFFDVKFAKKSSPRKTIELASTQIKLDKGRIKIPCFKRDPYFKTSSKTQKKLKRIDGIKHNCDLMYFKGNYWLMIPIPIQTETNTIKSKEENIHYCGVDPGIKTFATTFGNNGISEYKHNQDILDQLNKKMQILKTARKVAPHLKSFLTIQWKGRNGFRKRHFNKLEKKKKDYVDGLQWQFINKLLDENDVVFFGDIKSHDIVKKRNNSPLNQQFNDLKFYLLKQRLQYKALCRGKKICFVDEKYTSKCCSCCGQLYTIGTSRVFKCPTCKFFFGRDANSAKNILMKGIIMNNLFQRL